MAEQLNHVFRSRARQNDGRTTQSEVDVHDHGADTVAVTQVFFGDHLATAQTALDATCFDNDVAFVHTFDSTDEDFFAARHEVVEQHFALSITDFLQNDLLGCHSANATDGQRLDAFFDVFALFDIRHTIAGVHQEFFGIGVLQACFVRHNQPTAESFVVTAVAVHGDTDVYIAFV